MDKIKTKLKFIKSDRTESWVGFVSINTKTGYIKGVREDAKGPKKVCIVTHELEPIIEPNVLYDVQMVPMKNDFYSCKERCVFSGSKVRKQDNQIRSAGWGQRFCSYY